MSEDILPRNAPFLECFIDGRFLSTPSAVNFPPFPPPVHPELRKCPRGGSTCVSSAGRFLSTPAHSLYKHTRVPTFIAHNCFAGRLVSTPAAGNQCPTLCLPASHWIHAKWTIGPIYVVRSRYAHGTFGKAPCLHFWAVPVDPSS